MWEQQLCLCLRRRKKSRYDVKFADVVVKEVDDNSFYSYL